MLGRIASCNKMNRSKKSLKVKADINLLRAANIVDRLPMELHKKAVRIRPPLSYRQERSASSLLRVYPLFSSRSQVARAGSRDRVLSWSGEETLMVCPWSGPSLVHVPVVTCELILAAEAILTTISAADHAAWKLRRFSAMFGTIVSYQIAPLREKRATSRLGAFVSSLAFIMNFFVSHDVIVIPR